jgi:cyclophilin family peptidyl-prolyl cis-trans isomerase
MLTPNGISAQISNVLDGIEDQLNTAVIERDFDTLWTLRTHSDGAISYRASMALIHSDPVHNEWLFQQVIRSTSLRDWIVLSHSNLETDHLKELQRLSSEQEISKEYACEVFYRQGDIESLQFLLNGNEEKSTGDRCAMAIGGLLSRVEVSDTEIRKILDLFEQSTDLQIKRNLLYGFFRSDMNRPARETDIHRRMADLFMDHTNSNPISLVDQYFVRALGAEGVSIAIEGRSREELSNHTQFAVEKARETAQAVDSQSLRAFTEILIQHPNKHVRIQLLESLKEAEHVSSDLLPILENHLNPDTDNPEVLLSYLDLRVHLGQDISGRVQSLDSIAGQNPYLINRVYALMEVILDPSELTDMLLDDLSEEGIRSYRAAEALGSMINVDSLDEESQNRIKQTLLDQILNKNRSVLEFSVQVLGKTGLQDDEVLSLIDLYNQENKNTDNGFAAELYMLLAEIAPERYENLAEPVLKPFRVPDMNRLIGLGTNPVWILETNKGEIRIRLYPEEAPFTVSSVLNLTNSGYYDDVAFHRVVKGHVIQGGDFDRRDGFGGPPYRIPTEPSIETFSRGKVGVASSGQDTEGSQFFITHTWRPHLDGLYTIFGEVIEGMEVVDRIQIGDMVIHAGIE